MYLYLVEEMYRKSFITVIKSILFFIKKTFYE